MNASHLLALPEAAGAAGILTILVLDALWPSNRRGLATYAGVAACAGVFALALRGGTGSVDGMLLADGVTRLARLGIAALCAGVLIAGHSERRQDDDHGAWVMSVLGLALGALLTAAAGNLVTLWLGLELMSLPSYALAAWRGGDRRAAEAGMKYVLFGGLASAVMLFGVSHVYGLTGHLDFAGIAGALAAGMPAGAYAALCLVGAGLAYKLALVPFHFYAPDVYQGAPALSVASIAVLPKIGAVAALVHVTLATVGGAGSAPEAFRLGMAAVACLSLVFAAFTALAQRDAKRIVAFSAVGHAGAMLLAVACLPDRTAVAAAAFYLAGYAVANLGALVCLGVMERERGASDLATLAGAIRRWPWLTAALCLFLFSLAGLPPLAGFLGKWGVLREALRPELRGASQPLTYAALVLLVATVISAWSYLLIVRAAVLVPAPLTPMRPQESTAPRRLGMGTTTVIAACAGTTVALGLWLDGFAVIGRWLG